MDIMQFISDDLLILVVALWFIGYMLKSTNKINNAIIPFVVTILGIIAVIIMHGTNINSVLEGIISASVAVYGQNIIKQSLELKGLMNE